MDDFIQDFGIKEPIRLEQNYRSQGNILEAANALIANNPDRLGKELWTSSGKGEKITVIRTESDNVEADFVADTIKEHIDEGVPLREIAVLFRSNAQSRVLESALNNRGIPYIVYGGLRFYDRAEVKNALAYMRLAENTDDDSAFLRVVNVPARGIGAKTIEQLVEIATAKGISLYDASVALTGAGGKKVDAFKAIIEDLRSVKDSMNLADFVDYTVDKSGLLQMYELEMNGQSRVENLRELTSAAKGYIEQEAIDEEREDADATENLSALAGFLSHATLEAGDNQAKSSLDAVQLMTIHAAKGLEFEVVFITGLEEGLSALIKYGRQI